MSTDQLILLIDCSRNHSFVAISEKGKVIAVTWSEESKRFSLHEAIQQMLKNSGRQMKDLDAVAVTEGPGSYTGLRVGMAAAKGICFALGKPLIAVSTLQMMAQSAIDTPGRPESELFCPVIDARRNEVFLAVYDKALNVILEPQPMIAGADFPESVRSKKVLLFGDGAQKLFREIGMGQVMQDPLDGMPEALSQISATRLNNRLTANIIWAEPAYLKEFYFR